MFRLKISGGIISNQMDVRKIDEPLEKPLVKFDSFIPQELIFYRRVLRDVKIYDNKDDPDFGLFLSRNGCPAPGTSYNVFQYLAFRLQKRDEGKKRSHLQSCHQNYIGVRHTNLSTQMATFRPENSAKGNAFLIPKIADVIESVNAAGVLETKGCTRRIEAHALINIPCMLWLDDISFLSDEPREQLAITYITYEHDVCDMLRSTKILGNCKLFGFS